MPKVSFSNQTMTKMAQAGVQQLMPTNPDDKNTILTSQCCDIVKNKSLGTCGE